MITVLGDGRVDIDCDSKLARAISLMYSPKTNIHENPPSESTDTDHGLPIYNEVLSQDGKSFSLRLNIVIQVVGSRGDVQPFVALGSELQRRGHRVRLATHDLFDTFVRESGLEYYPIGGNPAALMAYMVKNPGLIPSLKSIQAGEIQQKREMIEEMLEGFWNSCIRPDTQTNKPFVADAIIANPPSFAHVHCAQALGIPVHLMFTMPWTSTTAFPHPLANLKNVGPEPALSNYISYGVVDYLTWQGLGDVVNKWRRTLHLEDVAMFDGPKLAESLKIPFTYCWSPALVPKPTDWAGHIGQSNYTKDQSTNFLINSLIIWNVCGFFFREAPSYTPPESLAKFLSNGPTPVYIGFGSIVLEDPDRMIKTIVGAVRETKIRAIISKGWSDLAGSEDEAIYWIGDCPHEWLFQHVAAVVHHGGAGTTACGLRNGKPTTIIPFFGDQPFWGDMVANAGAGPKPIRQQHLNVANLADAIRYCLSPRAVSAAQSIAAQMESENGVKAAVDSWHRQLPLERMQCDLIPSQPAAWAYAKSKKPIKYQSNPITIDVTRWDPVSGGASAVMATAVDMTGSITGMVTKPIEEYRDEQRRRARDRERQSRGLAAVADERSSAASVKSSDSSTEKRPSLAGKMAGASAKSIGLLGPSAAKGMLVDIPLALTEGLRTVPKHFGTEVRTHGPVTDAKSGAVVAGKTFVWGFVDGMSDLVMQPVKGASEEGAIGAAKGLGKGAVSLVAKSGAGMFGLFAYPSAGIAKSLRSAVYSGTRKTIANEKHGEGQWLVGCNAASQVDTGEVLAGFERLRQLK
ncbi:sterol 3-beta-glucosyltransferase UGT80B1 [Colletotrichum spaethianum]|uniref:Sterol 3-beta-glucosyltransferase UGT80B1 n=1 Tax=Colletotrichum spaethianum TaxID=700344 RepID=A0AA37PC19_9PEZI|nr:sterol 3-beta-glucosyltransferase UGT80B1 [Colletotrichum spaethianum]GKT49505.1 sterol 3-beta-glucosyltransferase UGT80B1 [Colletotrichum spaethianum]